MNKACMHNVCTLLEKAHILCVYWVHLQANGRRVHGSEEVIERLKRFSRVQNNLQPSNMWQQSCIYLSGHLQTSVSMLMITISLCMGKLVSPEKRLHRLIEDSHLLPFLFVSTVALQNISKQDDDSFMFRQAKQHVQHHLRMKHFGSAAAAHDVS